jgi:hypothetical protein
LKRVKLLDSMGSSYGLTLLSGRCSAVQMIEYNFFNLSYANVHNTCVQLLP